jgi:S1-C subfamily serine protease/uncharacterized caspase-like protein
MWWLLRAAGLFGFLFALATPGAHAQNNRVALVIGIDRYDNLEPRAQLKKARADARSVADALTSVGFTVIHKDDVTRSSFNSYWQDFLNQLAPGDTAAFYFAGHGIELGGRNYLLPRDVPNIRSGRDELTKRESLSLQEFLADLREKGTRLNLVILDACRDNPFEQVAGRSVGSARGLVVTEPPEGTFIMYSAGSGESALDRLGDTDRDPNSVYTRQLLPLLRAPSLSLTEVAEQVRVGVRQMAATVQHRQTPAYYNQVLGRVCLAGGDCAARSPLVQLPTAQQATAPPERLSEAAEAWDRVKETKSIPVLDAFVGRYKDTFYAELARARREDLRKEQVAISMPKSAVATEGAQEHMPANVLRSVADPLGKVMASVASIEAKTQTTSPNPAVPTVPKSAPFEEFFEEFFKNRSSPDSKPKISQTSGFVVSDAGLVVTSYAAVKSADEITVTINGVKYKAKSVGGHEASDLALVKIDGNQNFKRVVFSKRNVAIGEQVLMVGAPYGLAGSARMIKVKSWQKMGELPEVIELNGALIKGEGGAAIFDLAGEVVGVAYGNRESAGYAIPANVAAYVVDQIRQSGAVRDNAGLSKETSRARELSSTSSTRLATEILPELINDARKGIVFIDAYTGSGAERKLISRGLGFVIDGKEGIIVTCKFVIDGADEIIVGFHDSNSLKVDKVLGRDSKTEVTLLKVTPTKPLPFVALAPPRRSLEIKVGDRVMAIGNPSLAGSVTVGIISAKKRDIGSYSDFLQTDATINKGDAGGPLFNMDGEIIGVITSIMSASGSWVGVGFALPSDIATTVVDQLRQYGEVRRGWLGVKIQPTTEDVAKLNGVKENSGVLIARVTPNGPAAKAGVQDGDIILKFDGKDVTSTRQLPHLVAESPIGTNVSVELARRGQKKTLKVAVAQLFEVGEDCLRHKDPELRIKKCSEVIGHDAGSEEAYYNRGKAYYDKKEHDRAIADLNKVIEFDAKHAEAYYSRGAAWEAKGEKQQAIADYRQTLANNPKHQYANDGLKRLDSSYGGAALTGLVLAPLNDELRTKHGISSNVKGLVALEVKPTSPAAEKGLKVGDVIVEVSQEAVVSVNDFARIADKAKTSGRKVVLMRVEDSKGNLRFITLPIQ